MVFFGLQLSGRLVRRDFGFGKGFVVPVIGFLVPGSEMLSPLLSTRGGALSIINMTILACAYVDPS